MGTLGRYTNTKQQHHIRTVEICTTSEHNTDTQQTHNRLESDLCPQTQHVPSLELKDWTSQEQEPAFKLEIKGTH